MTTKKRRQRGSRTHGGGSHKNRRGAGHRGGRGAAGRSKHEFHNHPPLGKKGFNRPDKVTPEIETINVQKVDEDAALFVDRGSAVRMDDGYWIDLKSTVEDGWEVDIVKLLAKGYVKQKHHIVTDECSDEARELVEEAGGTVVELKGMNRPKEISKITEGKEDTLTMVDHHLSIFTKRTKEGAVLEFDEIRNLLELGETGDLQEVAHDIACRGFENTDEIHPLDVPALFLLKSYANEHDLSAEVEETLLKEFFERVDTSSREASPPLGGAQELRAELRETIPNELSPEELYTILNDKANRVARADKAVYGMDDPEALRDSIRDSQRKYLNLVKDRVVAEG